jgi:hypothetical protein
VKVFRPGRFNGQSGEYDEVTSASGHKLATLVKIVQLKADPLGDAIEVDEEKIVDGWFDASRYSTFGYLAWGGLS